jgi:hypothetical protein
MIPVATSTLRRPARDDLGTALIDVISASCAFLEGAPNKLLHGLTIIPFDRCRGERRQLLNNLGDAACRLCAAKSTEGVLMESGMVIGERPADIGQGGPTVSVVA